MEEISCFVYLGIIANQASPSLTSFSINKSFQINERLLNPPVPRVAMPFVVHCGYLRLHNSSFGVRATLRSSHLFEF
jgi:hypothetical protein